jgi:hypothetical protein
VFGLIKEFDKEVRNKFIPVTGRRVPESCHMSRLPHSLDNYLIEGGENISLTFRSPFISQKDSL